jgi:hypothetical protein
MKPLSFLLPLLFACSGHTPDKLIHTQAPAVPAHSADAGFAVVELFTSEGCSSCPPADQALLNLQKQYENQPVLLLGFHVDYWNYLGWKDVYSDAAFSQRQRWYATIMNSESVYTPQAIVNGRWQTVGSQQPSVNKYIQNAIKQPATRQLQIADSLVSDRQLRVRYKTTGNTDTTQLVVVLVQKKTTGKVTRGENKGETLTHINIVRGYQLVEQPGISGEQILSLPDGLKKEEVFVAAYLQQTSTGHILSMARL